MLDSLPPNRVATAFDVGANEGPWTAMLLHAQPSAHVHCFEIVPAAATVLARRFECTQSVTVNAVGLGSGAGTTGVYLDPTDSFMNTTVAQPDHRELTMLTTPVVVGDEYIAEHGIESIDFLKVDTEGADIDVLRGFRKALERGAVAMVQFEYNYLSQFSRTLLADFFELLGGQYTIGEIRPHRVEFTKYDRSLEDYQGPNCLAVRTDLRELIELLG